MSPPRAVLSWSSGKDCALALMEARRQGLADVVAILSTTNAEFDRVAMHGTRTAILQRQAEALDLPLIEVPLPWPCPNVEYEARMEAALARVRETGAEAMIFGDIFLADVRAYREAQLASHGMTAIFPLWGRDTARLARGILFERIEARVVCVDTARLDPAFAGRAYDAAFLADLPPGIDPCGENGEFHTAVLNGPMFLHPVTVRPGETVLRDGFAFADLVPA